MSYFLIRLGEVLILSEEGKTRSSLRARWHLEESKYGIDNSYTNIKRNIKGILR